MNAPTKKAMDGIVAAYVEQFAQRAKEAAMARTPSVYRQMEDAQVRLDAAKSISAALFGPD